MPIAVANVCAIVSWATVSPTHRRSTLPARENPQRRGMILSRFMGYLSAGLAGFALLAGPLQGQDTRRAQATRAELEASLAELEKYATSSGYSSRLRNEKAREAANIKARLQNGDLQV